MVSLVCLVCQPLCFDCAKAQLGRVESLERLLQELTSGTANTIAGHAKHLCTMYTLNLSNVNYFYVQIFTGRIFRVGEDIILRNTL